MVVTTGSRSFQKASKTFHISQGAQPGHDSVLRKPPVNQQIAIPITDPWDWYIHLHEWLFFLVNVGK